MIAPVYDSAGPLLAQAGFSNDGLWAFLYVVTTASTDYDLCWIYLGPRPPTVPLTVYVAASRKGKVVGQWAPLNVKPAFTVDLSCSSEAIRQVDKYSEAKVCGASTIKVLVGLDGSPSSWLTSLYFEDKNNPLLEQNGKKNPVAPGYAKHLSSLVRDTLHIASLASR